MRMFPRIKRIHFVGIGGIGMSGIAEVLLNLGYSVSGSDMAEGQTCRRLASLGAAVHIGHRAENVGDAHVVVVSSAIRPENPEVVEALSKGIPVIPRAEMLAELMRMKHGVAVAGAHGKTTTTSMLATCLAHAGLDPTVVIGGRLNALGTNAVLGQGPYLVAEADESDGSFLLLNPVVAVVTNIDPEHLDYYGTLDAIKQAFAQFVGRIPFYGSAVLCIDDPHVRRMLPGLRKHHLTYGFSPQADLRAENLRSVGPESHFEVWLGDQRLGAVRLKLPGKHNVLNALATIGVGLELDIPFQALAEGLETFAGVQRRFQRKGEAEDVLVVDDYGHHPSEIKATLAAARAGYPERRLFVVFQPHRYTRTRDLFDAFVDAFHDAHELVLTGIYAAAETPIPGVSSERLALAIREAGHRHVSYEGDKTRLLEAVTARLRPGDLLLTLGAGDVWKVGEGFLRARGAGVEGSQA